jgi:hypothetical protein
MKKSLSIILKLYISFLLVNCSQPNEDVPNRLNNWTSFVA